MCASGKVIQGRGDTKGGRKRHGASRRPLTAPSTTSTLRQSSASQVKYRTSSRVEEGGVGVPPLRQRPFGGGAPPPPPYIDKHRSTIYKTIRCRPIFLECMGAERQERAPCHLSWWQQVLDYSGKEKGEEVGSTGGLDSPLSSTYP